MSRTSPPGTARPKGRDKSADRLDLSPVQIGASALSAVTAAIGASFFGVGGTIVGAAFGAVVSTIAGALYTRSLDVAHGQLKKATVKASVRVRQVPAADQSQSPTAAPPELPPRAAGRPSPARGATPGDTATRPGGDLAEPTEIIAPVAAADETVVLDPDATRLIDPETFRQAGGDATRAMPADATRLMPPVDPGPVYADGPLDELQDDAAAGTTTPVYKRRPVVILAAVSAAGFLVALLVITLGESILGRPLSDLFGSDESTGGTSIGRVVTRDSTPPEPTVTPTDDPTGTTEEEPTEDPDAQPTEEVTEDPDAEPTPANDQDEEPQSTDNGRGSQPNPTGGP